MKGVYSCLSMNWLNTKHLAVSMNGTPLPLSLCEYTMSLAVSGPRALISFKYFLKAPSTSPSAGGEQGSNSIWAPHPTPQTPSIIWPAMAQAPGKGLYPSPNKVGDNIETTFWWPGVYLCHWWEYRSFFCSAFFFLQHNSTTFKKPISSTFK